MNLHTLTWSTPRWVGVHGMPLTDGISPRGGHSVTRVGSRLIFIGGYDVDGSGNERDLCDIVSLDLQTWRFASLSVAAPPPPQTGRSAGGVPPWSPPTLDEFHITPAAIRTVRPTRKELFDVRSGHSATLLPYDGSLAILILGGRHYVAAATNRHFGRDESLLLLLKSE